MVMILIYKTVDPRCIKDNLIKCLAEEWALITAGNEKSYNMMTASWGFFGEMWNKECAVCAIRPQRYTYDFVDNSDIFTLCFMGDNKAVHKICGRMSGRDIDKLNETGLTPIYDNGAVYYEECKTVIICKKLYADTLKEECFTDPSPLSCYQGDYHKMFVGEIIKVLVAE